MTAILQGMSFAPFTPGTKAVACKMAATQTLYWNISFKLIARQQSCLSNYLLAIIQNFAFVRYGVLRTKKTHFPVWFPRLQSLTEQTYWVADTYHQTSAHPVPQWLHAPYSPPERCWNRWCCTWKGKRSFDWTTYQNKLVNLSLWFWVIVHNCFYLCLKGCLGTAIDFFKIWLE